MKRIWITLTLVAALGAAGAAHATSVVGFDPTGSGSALFYFGAMDWNEGNALADGAVPLSPDPNNPTAFTLYYHAQLSRFIDASGNPISNDGGLASDYEITVVAGFGETGYRIDSKMDPFGIYPDIPDDMYQSTAYFDLDLNNPTNFFQIWIDEDLDADNLAGTGFQDDEDGDNTATLIMEGRVVRQESGNFTTTRLADSNDDGLADKPYESSNSNEDGVTRLDSFGQDNYYDSNTGSTLGTLFGNGGFQVTVAVDWVHDKYFITPPDILIVDLFADGDLDIPFDKQNPSSQFWTGSGYTAPDYGMAWTDGEGNTYYAVNGLPGLDANQEPVFGKDFHFEADVSAAVQVVPEPGTMLLLGSGLVGIAGAARRRRKGS